ncbi:hypothetical protein RRG08_029331 [Elysia crispata]|uniref:Uncharacterized protein n=1 Tax=Elysia crispata TaxID=231223 RepID=A0AAE1ARX0_9GAST|nr:hypothetical protein RRG08_029331 [Elysia crispata]
MPHNVRSARLITLDYSSHAAQCTVRKTITLDYSSHAAQCTVRKTITLDYSSHAAQSRQTSPDISLAWLTQVKSSAV